MVDGRDVVIKQRHIDLWLEYPNGYFKLIRSALLSEPAQYSPSTFHER